jgi:hypothetical protein
MRRLKMRFSIFIPHLIGYRKIRQYEENSPVEHWPVENPPVVNPPDLDSGFATNTRKT